MKVALGSKSPIKREAVQSVLPADAMLLCFDTKSGVPAQPIGKNQTLQGARNRARLALDKAAGQADLGVAFENGMWQDDAGFWVDGAAVVVISNGQTGEESVGWTETVRICFRPDCKRCCDPDKPDGSPRIKPGVQGNWSELKDPHIVLTGRPRQTFLSETLRTLLEQLQEAK